MTGTSSDEPSWQTELDNVMDTQRVVRAVVPKPARALAASGFRAAEVGQQRVFERWLGVSTTGDVYYEDGVAKTDRVFYSGCQWIPVWRALRRLSPGPSDVFVDLGAGKGQALLIAARLAYQRAIGVEVDDELARAASHNVERARSRLRVRVIDVLSIDALAWRLPDDASVVFMYCPFIGPLFHEVLNGVFESHDRHPRDFFLVYCFPFEHNWLLSTGRVEVEGVLPARWPTVPWWWRSSWVIVTYRVIPHGHLDQGRLRRRVSRTAPERRWSGPNDHRFWVGEPGAEKVYSRA